MQTSRRMTVGGARNTGLRHVTSRYVYFQDADDLMAPGTLRRLRAELDAHPEAILANGPVYAWNPRTGGAQAHLPAPVDDADLSERTRTQDVSAEPSSFDPLRSHGHKPGGHGSRSAQRRLSQCVLGQKTRP